MLTVVWAADDAEAGGAVAVAERQAAGEGDGLDAGQARKPRLELALELDALLVIVIGIADGRDLQRGEMVRLEAGVDVEQTIEALAEQAGADEEHHGHRQLDDHEVRAEATPDGAR